MNGTTPGAPETGTAAKPPGAAASPPRTDRGALGVGTALAMIAALAMTAALALTGASATAASATGAARQPAEIGNKVFVKTAEVHKYGKVLVDQKGLALYYNTDDKPSRWACTGACLVVWPPLTFPRGETLEQLSHGISGLGTVSGVTGPQVTWHGKPLYTFSHDSPGTVKGEGIGHVWYVVQLSRTAAGSNWA
jgi:predicted lipoprotein with Yx(FWY)xxD motif